MRGIPAYNMAGLRANFAGSDLLVDTPVPTRKLLVQVKTGYRPSPEWGYMTQCSGDDELAEPKFVADFVVFVNLDKKAGVKHEHNGELDVHHLTFYVVPRDRANSLYRADLEREHARPLKNGGQRKLGNLAVNVAATEMAEFKDAWHFIREAGSGDACSPARQRGKNADAANRPCRDVRIASTVIERRRVTYVDGALVAGPRESEAALRSADANLRGLGAGARRRARRRVLARRVRPAALVVPRHRNLGRCRALWHLRQGGWRPRQAAPQCPQPLAAPLKEMA
jgi:hypothetical protein